MSFKHLLVVDISLGRKELQIGLPTGRTENLWFLGTRGGLEGRTDKARRQGKFRSTELVSQIGY
jgi:hypothetical protein